MTTPFFMRPLFGMYNWGIVKILNLSSGFTMGLVLGQLIDNYPTWWGKIVVLICVFFPFYISLLTTELQVREVRF